MAHHHAVARAGMHELSAAQVDAHVRDAPVGVKKHQVARSRTTHGRPPGVVLRVRGSRQPDPQTGEDVLYEPGAVKARSARSPEHVGNAQEAQRASGQFLCDPRGTRQNSAGKAVNAVMVRGRRGNDKAGSPLSDVRTDGLIVGVSRGSRIIELRLRGSVGASHKAHASDK